jgi:hypothetical protein
MLVDLDIIMLEQLLDMGGSYLITWQQLKISRKKSKKRKKATWYKEIEEKVLISKEKREVKDEYKTGIENLLGMKNSLEEISSDKRKREWIIYEDSNSKRKKVGRVQKKKGNSILVEHWKNKENEENREEIRKCEGCLSNKEKAYKECRAWQPKRKILGAIPKNCVNREAEVIDFSLRSIATNRDDQGIVKAEWIFAGLRAVEERELEIIEAQSFNLDLARMLKEKA